MPSLTSKKTSRLNNIAILPGNMTVHQGEALNLSAVGYTSGGDTVSGLKFKWTVQDVDRKRKVEPLPNGSMMAALPGTFLVTAEADGIQAQATITVVENKALMMLRKIQSEEAQGRSANATKIKEAGQYSQNEISSASTYEKESSLTKPEEGSTTQRPADEQGWGGGNWWTADDPGNQTGNPPGNSPQASAGNGNFQLVAPVSSLTGRGLDVNLSLTYNSRLWSKSGNQMSYDSDRGFPAPGWSFGFGKMMNMGNSGGCMLVDGDGTRRSYTGSISSYTYGSYSSMSFSGHTADGTFIDYDCYYSSSPYGKSVSGTARLSNGTTIYYNSSTTNGQQAFPTLISDAQGNYINMTYRSGHGPEIDTVTDTMGRVSTFNYDSLNRLVSVDVPKFNNGGTRTAVRIHYKQITLSPGFAYPLTTDVATWSPYVVDAIYYPGTGTGYWFNDSDSYSSYGMIAKVQEQRGMSWSAGPDTQGTVTAGTTSKQELYNYPLTANYALTDSPTFTTMTESWDSMDTAPAVTSYVINTSASPRTITVTQPNGSKNKQYSYNNPGVWNDGLLYQDETLDSSDNVISKSVVTWAQGSYDTPRPSHMEVTDEANQTVTTDFTYGTNYNQLVSKKEYSGSTLLRESKGEYENNSNYTYKHIFNLPKVSEIFDGQGTRVSRVDYEYDDNAVVNGTGTHNLKATPSVIMHYSSYDPYTTETYEDCTQWAYNYPQCNDETTYAYVGEYPQFEIYCPSERYCAQTAQYSVYDSSTQFRGNVTKKTGYTNASNLTGAVAQNLQYDITGNLVATSSAANEAATYNYDVSTQFAYPTSQTVGSTDPNSPHRNTSSMVYDFNTGVVKQTTDYNGRTSSTTYDAETLRPLISTSPTGAYFKTFYNDAAMTTTEEHYESNGNLSGKGVTYLNGMGKVRREESLAPGSVWDIVETKYTNLNDVWKQSKPYRAGDTVQWTENGYDILGRINQVTEADGSTSKAYFNETSRPDSASTTPGQTVRIVDGWGRERWERYNQDRRLVELVEPNPNGNGSVFASGSLVTKYTLDVLGRMTETEQGSQHRYFKYDSLGQMTRQKLAEQKATLDDNGTYVGVGNSAAKWGDAFWYDGEANLTMKTDARGVKTYYSYQISGVNDPLGRLQSKFEDLSGPHDTSTGTIWQSPYFSYEYMTTGDKNRIKKIRTSGILTEDYAYDSEGRVSDYTQTVDYRQSYPMTTSYLYDSLDRIKERREPAQYGLAGSPRRLTQNTYDVASRLSTRTVNSQQQVGNIVYDASNRTTSLKVGTAGTNQVTENYTYNAQTGFLTNQNVVRNGTTLMDLSYDYQRNNSLGNISGQTGQITKIIDNQDSNKNREYKYDTVGRLIEAKGGVGLSQQQYGYDRYGNRTSVAASGVAANSTAMPADGISGLAYDSASNRITTAGYEYDSAGNQTRALAADGSWIRYEYDSSNRIQIVKKDDGTNLQAYQYGSTNVRLMDYDYISNRLIIFANEGGTNIAEYTEFTSTVMTWTKSYSYLGSKLLSTSMPNGTGGEVTDFDHPDQLGTRMVTNQQSGSSFKQVTLPFGTALAAESSGSLDKRFTSYERSSRTGLDYAINRTYDSKLGRFTQVDPIGMSAVDIFSPQTLNLYTYCGNDPINHTDANGLFFGFLKKLFNFISKILKYIAVAVAIVVAVITIVLMPASAALWFKIFTIVGAIANAASAAFEVLNLKTLSTIFGIIGAAASFGSSLLDKAGHFYKFWEKGLKQILGVIKAGANLASKVLSAAGHTLASNIMGVVGAVAGALDTLNGVDGKSKWKSPWQVFKAVRGVAQKIAVAAGAKRLAMILDTMGLPEDVENIYGGIQALRAGFKPKEPDKKDGSYTWKGLLLQEKDFTIFGINLIPLYVGSDNAVGNFTFYTSNIGKINTGLSNILKKVVR